MDFKEISKPIYQQIADRICDDVLSKAYMPRDRIPSVREYSAKVQVNSNTVMRSYDYLTNKGILFNKRGIGFFISDEAPELITRLRRETFFNDEMQYFFSRLLSINVTPEDLTRLYAEYISANDLTNHNNVIQK